MDDLIRKQTVLNMIDNLQFGDCGTATERLTKLYDAVENQPSVDAVEVVRCKDCECYDLKNYYCTYLDNSNGSDGFCNFGERKTDG